MKAAVQRHRISHSFLITISGRRDQVGPNPTAMIAEIPSPIYEW
jgi:hypothetical protein